MPFRKLADEHDLSPAQVYRKVLNEMDKLPENTWLSNEFCNRWSGRLVIDGKYVAVKGYDKKIPFIYGIGFLTHDIPVGLLVPSENLASYVQFFNLIRTIHYPLQIIIADDNGSAREALKITYPTIRMQLCHNHYLENVRQLLQVRTEEKYRIFFYDLKMAFSPKNYPTDRDYQLRRLLWRHGKHDQTVQTIIADVMSRYDRLFAYGYLMKHCPNTTNIIESYNSHLQARLKSIKGFQSFKSAERWFNAWMLRRRTKAFTDCGEPFKHLNGKMPIEMSIKKDASIASVLKLINLKKS